MKLSLVLVGRVPSKKNSRQIVCRGRYPKVLPSEAYLAWHVDALLQLRAQRPPKIEKCLHLQFVYFAPDNRKADLSNKFESVADLLVDYGVMSDDNYFVMPTIGLSFGGVDKKKPRAEIIIEY